MATTKNVPLSGSVVLELTESFLVFLGYIATILILTGLPAKSKCLVAPGLVDTFILRTRKKSFAKLNLFLPLLWNGNLKMIWLMTLIGISLAWKSTLLGLTTRTFWNLLPLTNESFSAIKKMTKSSNSRSIKPKLI